MLAFISCPPAARLPRRAGGLLAPPPQALTCRMCPHGDSRCRMGPPVGWGAAGPRWRMVLGSGMQGALQGTTRAAARGLRAAFSVLKTRDASSSNGDGPGACASPGRGSSFPTLCWGWGGCAPDTQQPGGRTEQAPSASRPVQRQHLPQRCAAPVAPCLCLSCPSGSR